MFIMSFPWALLVAGLIFVAVFATGIVVGLIISKSSYKPFLNMMIYDRVVETQDIKKRLDKLSGPLCGGCIEDPDDI